MAEVGDGRDVPDRSQKGVTVKQLLDGYLDHLRDHKGRRHSTLIRYRGLANGLPHERVASFDNLQPMPKSMLVRHVGTVEPTRLHRLCNVAAATLAC